MPHASHRSLLPFLFGSLALAGCDTWPFPPPPGGTGGGAETLDPGTGGSGSGTTGSDSAATGVETTGFATTGFATTGFATTDFATTGSGSNAGIVVEIGDTVLFDDARRFGMNLGALNQFAESNLLENVIPNPGFEPGEFASVLVLRAGATPDRVQYDHWNTTWNSPANAVGHPIGFWDDASYELLLGPAHGRSGRVSAFTHEDEHYTFYLDGDGAAPEAGNLLVVRQQVPGYDARTIGSFSAEPNETRPFSPGTQALRLHPDPGLEFRVILDSHGDPSAPKLLIADGSWRFAVWARAQEPGESLAVSFRRTGGDGVFFNRSFPLSTQWQYIEHEFVIPQGADAQGVPGSHNPLQFGLGIGQSEVLIDDLVFERADDDSPTVFHGALVQALSELRPGILRNWGLQLGSSLDNELSEAFARRTVGFAPNSRRVFNWHYGLHDFLELCATVGANPWYVIPPTWSEQELDDFLAYLDAPAGTHPYADRRAALGQAQPWTEVFETIHLEFGNETWASGIASVDPFAGGTFGGGPNAGQVTDLRFSQIRANPYFDAERFDLALGGQAAWSGRQQQLEANSDAHETIGLAPYYGNLSDESSMAAWFLPLYAHASQTLEVGSMPENQAILQDAGTQLAIYELNVHTLDTGSVATRNEVLSSQAAGISLPLVMLSYLREWGVRDQVVYKALQFSTFRSGGWLRTFGTLRDIRAGAHRRPTWLALELANFAILPELVTADVTGDVPTWTQAPINGIVAEITVPEVQAFAFRNGDEHSVVLFNLALDESHEATIALPHAVSGGATLRRLAADAPTDDNETSVQVTIDQEELSDFGDGFVLELPPHSMTALRWQSP